MDERLIAALESIAISLRRWVDGAYPEKKAVREAVVTHVPTEEDRALEAQGAGDDPIEEWIGLREQRFRAEKEGKAEKAVAAGDAEKAGD